MFQCTDALRAGRMNEFRIRAGKIRANVKEKETHEKEFKLKRA